MTETDFTDDQLQDFDGKNPKAPVYVGIKGTVFDVTSNREMYQPGKGYSVFAGKDASKALGKSSLDLNDCVSDYSDLTSEEMATLDKWYSFYAKKYPIVGKIVNK
jgi:membrane-associated progesterone receptor component